jgi:RecJ-like exonuclease
VFGFAESNNKIKVSARASPSLKINLKDIVSAAASKVGGEGGGHTLAAGALIPKGEENNFVNLIESELKKYGD